MKFISVTAIVAGVVLAIVGFVSRIRVEPIFGIESRAFAGISAVLFLLAIAINTLPEDL